MNTFTSEQVIALVADLQTLFDNEKSLAQLSNYTISDKAYYSEHDEDVYPTKEDFREYYPKGTEGCDSYVKCVALFDDNGDWEWYNTDKKSYDTALRILHNVDKVIETLKEKNLSDLIVTPLENLTFEKLSSELLTRQ